MDARETRLLAPGGGTSATGGSSALPEAIFLGNKRFLPTQQRKREAILISNVFVVASRRAEKYISRGASGLETGVAQSFCFPVWGAFRSH